MNRKDSASRCAEFYICLSGEAALEEVVPGAVHHAFSGAPHLLDSSLRCPRWIRQKVLDGRTVSRALARKHAARISSSTFVPRVASNALVRLRSLIVDTRFDKLIFHNFRKCSTVEEKRSIFFLDSLKNLDLVIALISLKIPGHITRGKQRVNEWSVGECKQSA